MRFHNPVGMNAYFQILHVARLRERFAQRHLHPPEECAACQQAGDPRDQHPDRLRMRLLWHEAGKRGIHEQADREVDQEDRERDLAGVMDDSQPTAGTRSRSTAAEQSLNIAITTRLVAQKIHVVQQRLT